MTDVKVGVKFAKKRSKIIYSCLAPDVSGAITGGEHTLLLSNQCTLQELRLRVAAEQVHRCLNNKGIVLDLINYLISAPEQGLQCLVWGTHSLLLQAPACSGSCYTVKRSPGSVLLMESM